VPLLLVREGSLSTFGAGLLLDHAGALVDRLVGVAVALDEHALVRDGELIEGCVSLHALMLPNRFEQCLQLGVAEDRRVGAGEQPHAVLERLARLLDLARRGARLHFRLGHRSPQVHDRGRVFSGFRRVPYGRRRRRSTQASHSPMRWLMSDMMANASWRASACLIENSVSFSIISRSMAAITWGSS
jgi:hypothetical protein